MSKLQKRSEAKVARKEKSEIKVRMKGFVMFLPNMVLMLGKLLKDSRVPVAEKALFVAAIVYVISPIDLIPDVFPFIGQVDDIYLVALTVLRLINRTDETVVRENWP
ncbi:MAG TPA: YkvA family protein, partial [Pyrinomonadaceae bacterium]|nr:YkvA family protein [Pyrinomonadaceae bacterium]